MWQETVRMLIAFIIVYSGYQSINNKINLLEERIKDLEIIAFNK